MTHYRGILIVAGVIHYQDQKITVPEDQIEAKIDSLLDHKTYNGQNLRVLYQ